LSKTYYDTNTNQYTFESGIHVIKEDLRSDTDWVTYEEYPDQFICRLVNGSIYHFNTVLEVEHFFSLVANSSVWAIGVENEHGVFAIFTSQNNNKAHGQYLFYPRLQDGKLSAYNMPLYAIFSSLYAVKGANSFNVTLQNKSLYTSNPINTLHFFRDSDKMGITFNTTNMDVQGATIDISHGFKYNFTDWQFHLITRFRCQDKSFENLGVGYYILPTDEAMSTDYKPNKISVSNATKTKTVNMSQAINLGQYTENWFAEVDIWSKNELVHFQFNFEDMENAGFTQKYMAIEDFNVPNGITRKSLLVGMKGYGNYINGTWIDIDPSTGDITDVDNNGVPYYGGSWQINNDYGVMGRQSGDYAVWYSAWDTDIVEGVSDVTGAMIYFRTWTNRYESDDTGIGTSLTVYNIGGNGDHNTAFENNLSYAFGTHYNSTSPIIAGSVWDGWSTNQWKNVSSSYIVDCLDYWASNRDSTEDWISFRFHDDNAASNYDDANWYEADYSGGVYAPIFSFNYTVPTPPNAPTLNTDSGNVFSGKSHTIKTDHTDDDGDTSINLMYIQYYYSSYNVTLSCPQATSSGSVTIIVGSGYVVGTPTYSHTTDPTDGYRVTWTITMDWDFVDDTAYTVYARTKDDGDLYSSWTSLDTDNTCENELIIKSGTTAYTFDSACTDAEYPDNTACDVEISANAAWTGTKDTTLDNGAFDIAYTPTAGSGDADSNFDFDLRLTDFSSGGSEGSGGDSAQIEAGRDNQVPTISISNEIESSSYLHAAYGTGSQGVYGSEMGASLESFQVWGVCTDIHAGLNNLVDDTSWGNNPSWAGSLFTWYYDYDIDENDNGDVLITYTITDNVGNSNTATYNFYEDNVAPSDYSLSLDADTNTGTGYDPNSGFYDDDSVDVTATANTSITETLAGLPINCYSYQRAAEGWSGWQSGNTYQFTSTTDGSYTLYVRVIDNVGNVGSSQSTSVVVDTDDPSGFTDTIIGAGGYMPHIPVYNYALYNFNTITWKNDHDSGDYFQVQINNNGVIGNSGYWKLGLDINSVFETFAWDTDALPKTNDFNFFGDTDGSNFVIRLVNNAGNYQEVVDWTTDLDNTAPTTNFVSLTEDPVSNYLYISGQTCYFSDLMGASYDWIRFEVTESDTGGAGVYRTYFSSWGTNLDAWSTDIVEEYKINNADTSGSFYAATFDNVGNEATHLTITMTEDTTQPNIDITGESESSDYLYAAYGTGFEGFYGSAMGSLQTYTISGTSSDSISGLGSLVDDVTTWGNNPSNGGSLSSWSFAYQIDASDNGNVLVTYTSTDNVGNSNTSTYDFYEDNTAPSGFNLSLDADNSATNCYLPNTGYYDDPTVDYTATVKGSITEIMQVGIRGRKVILGEQQLPVMLMIIMLNVRLKTTLGTLLIMLIVI
jgi:hypothetical protein